jgi:DNA invertase Pin-like site-specific DNA recombinase
LLLRAISFENDITELPSSVRRSISNRPGSGVPSKVDDIEHIATARRMKADGHTAKDIAKVLGVSRATLRRLDMRHPVVDLGQ